MVHVGDHTKTETEKADGGAMGQKTDESRHEGVENDEGVESEGVDCPVDGGAEGQEVDQPVNEPIGDKEGQGVDLPPSTWSMPQGGMTFPAEDWVKIMEKGEGDETVSNGEGFGESNGWGGGTVPNGDDPVLDRLLEMLPPISELVPHGIPPTAASEPNQLTFGDMGYQFGGFEEVVLPAGDKPVRSEEVVWPAGNTPGCLEGVGREIVGLVGFVSVPGQQDLEGGIRGKKRASEEGEAEAVDSRSASGREKHMRKGGNREVDDWVFLAEGYLRRGIDDVAWARCIDLWAKLERSALSRNSRLAESGLRPIELSKWVASRKWDSDPVVEDLLDYAQRWIAWWRAMQPACRKVEGRELPNELDDQMRKDVVSLKKAGANGLVVLLVGLKWWAPLRTDDWRWGAVVKDFVQCLEIFVG